MKYIVQSIRVLEFKLKRKTISFLDVFTILPCLCNFIPSLNWCETHSVLYEISNEDSDLALLNLSCQSRKRKQRLTVFSDDCDL